MNFIPPPTKKLKNNSKGTERYEYPVMLENDIYPPTTISLSFQQSNLLTFSQPFQPIGEEMGTLTLLHTIPTKNEEGISQPSVASVYMDLGTHGHLESADHLTAEMNMWVSEPQNQDNNNNS